MESEFEDPLKDIAFRAYWEGWQKAVGSESLPPIAYRTARSRFERWWKMNAE